ncbi:MAG: tetratricopeptide repeat protein [Proteobacteria bacterium]|nr:tetratricopeptide repeat protein [Pseudomonadota bacterium]
MHGRWRFGERAVSDGWRAASSSAAAMTTLAEQQGPTPARWRRVLGSRPLWLVLLSLGATCWALQAPFYLDAVSRIGLNPDLRQLGHLWDRLIYPPSEYFNFDRNDPSRPVVFALYTLIWWLAPNQPFGFTLFNLLLHALNAVLVFVCARWLLGRLWPERAAETPAFVVAALFALSPLNVGTAIYSYALTDVLALTFSLLALMAFVRGSERGRSSAMPWRWRLAAWSSLLAGLFAKQSLAVLPLAIVAADYFVLAAGRWSALRRQALTHLGLFAIVGAYLAWRQSYFGLIGDVEGVRYLWNRWDYLAAQPEVVLRYIGGLLVPIDLSLDHAFGSHVAGSWLPRVGLPWVVLLALLLATLRLALKGGAFAASAACALLWFFLQLAPTSSLMPTVDAMVERRVYLPSVGLYLFLVLVVEQLRQATRSNAGGGRAHRRERLWHYGPALLAGLVLCAFGLVSARRSYQFRDPVATWQSVVALYPDSPRALSNLAAAQLDRRHYRAAHALFQRATKLQSAAFSDWYNLGDIYERRDSGFYDPARATLMYRRALAVNPGYALVFFRLARLLQLRGEFDEARELYRRSIGAGVELVDSYNNLGLIELEQGRLGAARQAFQQALTLAPGYARARLNLERLEQVQGAR